MKKTISILLGASMILTSGAFVHAETPMEAALVAVKQKVNIPGSLTEFTTSSNDDSKEVTYYFQWADEANTSSISVQADAKGHILNYSSYNSDWYKDDNRYLIDKNFSIDTLENMAETELKQMAPDLFTSASDHLVLIPYSGNLSLQSQSYYSIEFKRQYNDIDVKGNTASISFMNTKDGFKINNAYINWDYQSGFISADKLIDLQTATASFTEKFPMRLSYRKDYNNQYYLEYTANGVHYLDARTAGEVTEDPNDDILYMAKDEKASLSARGAGANPELTPAEISELEKINSLKTTDQLLEGIYAIPEFGVTKEMVSRARMSSYIYKSDDTYNTSITLSDQSDESNDQLQTSIAWNAKTGELLSFSRYDRPIIYYDKKVVTAQDKDTQDKEAQKKVDAFLNRYFADKMKDTIKDTTYNTNNYLRSINGIPYTNNSISAQWDTESGVISSFNCQWDADISGIPSPNNIVDLKTATQTMYEKYPLTLTYILSDGKYTPVYSESNYSVVINAFTGKVVDYNGQDVNVQPSGNYNDVDGHWVADIAKKLASYGVALDGEALLPDQEITQAEFLNLVYKGVCGYYWNQDENEIYRNLIARNVLTDDEKNSKASITRENAIAYLLRAMGIKEVAEIKGIYICDFSDSDKISADKIGYCAIAKGFGIVKGSDGALYPQNKITRAEALAMIYNYLIR